MEFGLKDFDAFTGGLTAIIDKARETRGIAQREADTARAQENAGDKQWQDDRAAKNNEWQRLAGEYSSTAARVVRDEAFATWSHKQIWDALHGDGTTGEVRAGDIASGADGWRTAVQQTRDAFDIFNKKVESTIQNMWSGKSATAAIDATRAYSVEAQKLPIAFEEVANGISTIQGYLDQAKMSVEEPQKLSSIDDLLGHIPGNGVLKLHHYRAQEAHARAQQIMTTFYQPGVAEVDGRTPVLPSAVNPVQNPAQQPFGPGTGQEASNGPTGVGSGVPGVDPGVNGPGNSNPNGADPSSLNSNGNPGPGGANPDGTNPAGLNTNSTVPSSTDTGSPTGRPTAPGTPTGPSVPPATTTGPGSPSPVGGVPRGVPGINTPGTTRAPGGPGRSIPGGPNGSGTNPAAARATTGKAGAPGAGGMSPPGGGKKEDDEGTVQPKDYLVWERESELFGQLPPALPPGGVIGG